MFQVRPSTLAGHPSVIREGGESLAEIVPTRGGLVARFRVGDDELLYLDESTLADPAKNVRGGIPVLFPFAGKLEGDAYSLDGATWTLAQHGFARKLPWEVVGSSADADGARLAMRLRSDDGTRALFPREFELQLEVVLLAGALRLEATLTNPGTSPLPHAFGLHPYFRVTDKAAAAAASDATELWDNVARVRRTFERPDFTAPELDWHLLDHALPGTVLKRAPQRPIRLSWSDGYGVLVLWTVAGREFVCVEPWTAPAGAFPSGEGVRTVAPGEAEVLSFELSV